MRLEIAYAIPTSKLKANDDQMIVMDEGLFMFDYLWRDIYRKVRPLGQKRPSGRNAQQYLLSQRPLTLPQGTYNIVVEVGDRTSGTIGTFRTERLLTVSESSLDMSDLLLAQKIETINPFPEKRTDLSITPNPLRAYRTGQSASVYLEIYNLKKDEFGRTQYQIVYSISVPEKGEVDPSMFGAIDLTELDGLLIVSPPGQSAREGERSDNEKPASGNTQTRKKRANLRVRYVLAERNQMAESLEELRRAGQQSSTSISSVYAGDKSDDFTFLEIDLSTMPRGIYKLEVAITDLKVKKQVKRNAVFRVRE